VRIILGETLDNQHKLIKGYRDLSKTEIDLMNAVKTKAEEVRALLCQITDHLYEQEGSAYNDDDEMGRLSEAEPGHWLLKAGDDLQTGFMKLTRAIAQPTTF
jgi:hypothetical protein